jgi:type IV secretory pathway ATPase VirB11/archaellum biosynthesis ATPase
MNAIDQHNLAEIESLNQRGGRTLSFIDLISAGTMTEEMVAYCWTAIANGASFLTAARPGGAGKSTVLANLLALLPPGEDITTFADDTRGRVGGTLRVPASLSTGHFGTRSVPPTRCSLAHEIGSGQWYGYIWGDQVREFIDLKQRGHRLAACLHADTLDELTQILCTPPLSCSS